MDGGRKLSVGDCALFQAGNGPPFIGILRKVTQEKDTTKLVVNWLYRPADVKLAKGVPLEAAPNEIFYSFHKDEISAASLLHPCKVAFLRKGAELPPGVSSFVCRRVYDTANKCLWWLTDRDYTNEHQDEVDQLLERTKLEMQAVVQSGGPSPRSLTGPTSSQQQQLKASSEVAQNVTFAVSNKGKKKRERADQTLEPSKRERSLKAEDGESSPLKRERSMKPEEVASITDKDGGLQNPSSVERLVQLMQQDHNDGIRKAADVAARRAMFAGVVAATERDDCLSRFVQLGGLPILDDWLQEAHKGKVGDGGSPKEGDKGVEELLLTLLRALDKLPVDLDGLKTCSVGKSVNHLRSHKNPEIQKKARKLVEIWKKRVDAEMKLSGEGKSASNHALWNSYKQSSPDVVHSHLMKGGPTEVAVKSSGASAGSAKAMPNGVGASGFADGMAKPSASPFAPSSKPSSASPAVVKKEDAGAKLSTGSAPADAPAGGLAVKDEKSTSSQSQSQSNGQMWAGVAPGGKGGASSAWKEDSKSSSLLGAVSSKPAGSVARHPSLPGKGLLGVASGAQKDHLGGKPLIWSRSATDKSATSTVAAPEKGRDGGSDGGARDSPGGSQHRLIVRIPNPGRSPARMNSGSFDLSTPVSRGLSPSVPERSAPPNGDCSDAKSRLQNGNQPAGATADGCAEGLRMGSVADDDRDNYPGSAPSEPPGESEKRGDEADRSSKEAPDANGGSGGFAPRGGAVEAEDVKKGEAASSQAPGAPTADASASGATAMEVDDQGISLLASVAASEINRGVPSSSSSLERSQADDCNGEQDHGARLSSDGGASLLKEAGDKQQQQQQHQHQHQQQLTGNEDGDGKDSSEVAGAPVSSTVNPSKNRDDSGVEHNADSNGGKAGDAASNEEALQESTSGSAEGDTEDVEKRHFSVQEPGRVLDASGNTKTSLDRKGEERHMDESGSKAALAPCEPLPYSSDGNPSALSGADGLGCNQDGHGVVSSGKKDSHDEKKSSALGKSSLSGIELNVAYGSGGHDFKDSSEKDEEMKSSVESGGQSFGRRGNDNDGHKVSDMCTSFPEEEVLEVARQAAKEVEQMERWKDSKSGVMSGGDKEGQDVNSPGFKSSDPRDSGFSDTGREHRWKPHSSIEKVKDDDSRKRNGPYLEDNHDSVAERMDEGSLRSTAIGEADDDQARCGGGSGDRKLANSGQDGGGESALEGGQEHKRRAIDGRAPIRVPSFHSSQMLSIPNLPTLTSTTVNVQNVVKPSPRSLPAGEPTTPEQATETTGPNDGAVGGSDVSERPDFDLNEGFSVEESPQDDSTTSPIAPVAVVAALSSSATLQANGAAAPIAIVTATKGPFVLPASPMRTKSELGWKGSAATSAFRPAEPRRTPERQPEIIVPEPVQQMEVVKKVRPPLNIDLNIADDRGFEEVGMSAPTTTTTMSSQGSAVGMSSQAAPVPSMSISGITYHSEQSTSGPQAQMGGNFGARPILDLNLIDESEESGTLLETDPMLPEAMGSSTRSNNSSSSQVNCRVMRDFDLNDGPSVEEPVVDEQPVMSSLRGGPRLTTAPFIAVPAPGPGLRRGAEVVNVAAPWFANTAYPAVAIPAFSNRDPTYSVAAAAAAQSYLSAGQGPAPFSSDMYRGTAGLPSASGVAFPSSTQSYPYGTFPLPSGFGFTSAASFAANNAAPYMEPPGSSSFPVASSGVVPSSFARPPFLIPNIADMGPSDSSGGSGGWGARPSLDLNAGPEAADADGGRDDGMNMRHRHETSMLSGQVSLEQLRSYRVSPTAGSVGAQLPKRKEPDGGWDLYRSSGFKQQAWR